MSVLDIDDAKVHLNITQGVDDGELQTFIDAAEAAIENLTGPLLQRSITSVVRRVNYPSFSLPVTPVVSVETITGAPYFGSIAVDTTYLELNSEAGVVYFGGLPALLTVGPYKVTYTAGYAATAADLPADLLMAVKEMVRHLWMTQRGGGTSNPGPRPSDGAPNVPGAAYAMPIRVEQLLRPYMTPAIA